MPIEPREPDSEAGRDQIEEPEPQSQELERELEQTKSAYQRLAADFENYKRRKTQETQDLARYGSAALLAAILPALDNLARAVAHIDPGAQDGLSEGLRLTLRQLEEALLSQGVEKVASVGERFDPRVHDAVSTVAGEGVDHDTVVAELLPGYRLHERVVRPAQVTVAQASPPVPFGQGNPGEPETGDRLEAPEVTDFSA